MSGLVGVPITHVPGGGGGGDPLTHGQGVIFISHNTETKYWTDREKSGFKKPSVYPQWSLDVSGPG